MDIPGALSSVSTAIGIVRQLNGIDARVDEASYKIKIADVTSALAEVKLQLVEASEQIRDRDKTIADLRDQLKFRLEHTIRYRGLLYESTNGEPHGAPYCPSCVIEGNLIRTVRYQNEPGMPYRCPRCSSDLQFPKIFHEP